MKRWPRRFGGGFGADSGLVSWLVNPPVAPVVGVTSVSVWLGFVVRLG